MKLDKDKLWKSVKNAVEIKYYDMQHFDFGDFEPEDETHYETTIGDWYDGMTHKVEMTVEEIMKATYESTLKYIKLQIENNEQKGA